MSADRSEKIAGLRILADLLEQNPDMPLPTELSHSCITFQFLHTETAKAQMAAVRQLIGGQFTKDTYGPENLSYFALNGKLSGIHVHLVSYRNDVCERVVTGTREVTKTIPDPMVSVPVVEVTETVEDVEWVCGPLLAEAVES